MTLASYEFPLATAIQFGAGKVKETGAEAKKLGAKRVMLVADKGVISAGLVSDVEKSLKDEKIDYVIYDNIVPNPRDIHCMEGCEFAKNEKVDLIVAVGGGSSIDTAKAIGTLVTNGKDVQAWCGLDLLEKDPLPLIAVPTTAGTGSEVTFDAVITDTTTHEKLNILDLRIAPEVALVDPELLLGLPSHIMASCGVDAMTHAVEAYTCKVANPHTDAFALYAIELIQKNLRDAVSNPTIESCTGMMLGSNMAGIAFGYSDVGAVHCIAEALGGLYDTPHGVANAILLPTVTEFNIPADIEKHANMARYLGVDTKGMSMEEAAYSCVDALEKLSEDVGIAKMKDVPKIDPKDFRRIAEASERNLSTPDNAREINSDDYFELLNKAYYRE